jgi:tripartite-type tricarboxylate transporter receptor subunit TctC
MTIKTILIGLTYALAVALASPLPGSAAEYPERGITIVVPFPAGSTSDIIPRLLGPAVAKVLGTTVVIENQAGANGSVGAARVARAAPDGYTILLGTTGVLAINQWIYAKPQYVSEKDFAPIMNLASTPNVLVVNPSVKASTLSELIELAKAKPGSLSFASAGYGSTSHICGEALKVAGGIDLLHVPYQGPAPAIKDVLADRVSMICDNLSNVLQYVGSGTLKAVAVTAPDRSAQLPDVPTSREAGYPGVEAGIWYGLVAPASTPKDVIERLNGAFAQALRDPAATSKLEAIGLKVIGDKPDAFREFIHGESERMKSTVQRSGAAIQ